MVSSVGIGLVGLGDIARKRYIPQVLKAERARLAAVCSAHRSTFEDLRSELPCDEWHADFQDLVDRPDVDAVIVATPHPTHAEVAIAALAAGKHVLIEKPLATRLADALAIEEAAKASSAVVMALPWDQTPLDKLILSVLARGVLGTLVSVRLTNGGSGPLYRKEAHDPDWAFKARAGGGVLIGHGVYGLARLARIVGPATSIRAEMALIRPKREVADGGVVVMEVEDHCAISLGVATGQDVTFECGWTYAGPVDVLTITGTRGVLTSPGRSTVIVQGHDRVEGAATLEELGFSVEDGGKLAAIRGHEVVATDGPRTIVEDFVDCIVSERAPTASLDQAVHVTEQMTAAYRSGAGGGVRLPLTSTFAPTSGLPRELLSHEGLDASPFPASGRFTGRTSTPTRSSDVDELRHQLQTEHRILLRSFFSPGECEEILRWADFRDGRLRNPFGDPDDHPILSRVNAKLAEVFGRRYRHIQTAVHYSSDQSPNTHKVHIDFPQKLFAYSPEDNLQIWALLRARDLRPDDDLLHLWSGFTPDASKQLHPRQVPELEQHVVRGLTVGDVLVFSSWLPHSSGSLDHPYERFAFKVHYYSDRAVVDRGFLRQHLRQALRVSTTETHNGTGPAMFAAEQLGGAMSRRLARYPLALYRALQKPNKAY